jgi:hypothetical protein
LMKFHSFTVFIYLMTECSQLWCLVTRSKLYLMLLWFHSWQWSLMNFTLFCRAMKGKRSSHSTPFRSWPPCCWWIQMNFHVPLCFWPIRRGLCRILAHGGNGNTRLCWSTVAADEWTHDDPGNSTKPEPARVLVVEYMTNLTRTRYLIGHLYAAVMKQTWWWWAVG